MIQINNKKIDLLLQMEQDVPITKLLDSLTINDYTIMVICPMVFFSNVIGDLYDYLLDGIDTDIMEKSYVELKIKYKKKEFDLIFFITPNESKIINVPFKGEKIFNVGFKKVQL
jgi:hypothetical protein